MKAKSINMNMRRFSIMKIKWKSAEEDRSVESVQFPNIAAQNNSKKIKHYWTSKGEITEIG